MDVQRIAPRLWRWTARHPEWTPEARWPREVGCLYYEAPTAVVLIDPLLPADEEQAFLAALDGDVQRVGRRVHVLRTVGWHERSTAELIARYDATTVVPSGVEAISIEGIELPEAAETVFWLARERSLVVGDVLLGDADGVSVCPASWVGGEGGYPPAFRESLQRLLELPVERILLSHGEPVLSDGREALAAALASL